MVVAVAAAVAAAAAAKKSTIRIIEKLTNVVVDYGTQ
jgi:hypothetical protein